MDPIKKVPRRLQPRKFGNFKTSARAVRANVYGTQSYAGKPFISYAEHDRQMRDRLCWQHGWQQGEFDERVRQEALTSPLKRPNTRYR